MNNRKILFIICLIAGFFVQSFGQKFSGEEGFFNDIGYGARPMAMGGAFVGVADDAYSLLWNPAGLVDIQRDEASLMAAKQIIIPYLYLGYSQKMPHREDQAFGGGLIYSGDELLSELSLLGAYGISLMPLVQEFLPINDLSTGATIKFNYLSVGGGSVDPNPITGSGIGVAFDLGFKAQITSDFRLGMILKNMPTFTRNKYNLTKKTYNEFEPAQLVFGTSFNTNNFTLIAMDFDKSFFADIEDRVHVGIEFNIVNTVLPRMGFAQDLSAVRNAEYTFGFGLDYRYSKTQGVIFDYAYIVDPLVGTNNHRSNLNYYWNAKPRDKDGDRIADVDDKCINDPEDYDGFEDEDGCPDLDNDKDQIPDLEDECPLDPEDYDGFEDSDGCPELDNDKDGVVDSLDRCPLEAEDKDGFQDEDGCPDLDNDQDGIPDTRDQCPLEPEDMDGFQDFDGCPDIDFDGDGVKDEFDKCPNTPKGMEVGTDGCPKEKYPDQDNDGIPDATDKCPALPEDMDGFEDMDGCPDLDNDQDGILDSLDKCPNFKEDMDGFEDEDGCPELDNDQDGVLDSLDKCPDQKETRNNYKDEDGCPDTKPAEIKKGAKMILKGVNFRSGSAALTERSYSRLDLAYESLVANKDAIIEVRGYTDNTGNYEKNVSLSKRRADSVVRYLVNRGIDAKRLTSKGFGPADPIASNKTRDGRSSNRRIEFYRIK